MTKIAVTVITLNEEVHLKRCLESVKGLGEIVIVDSGSTDATLKIAKRYTDKIFHKKFVNYADQKNFAADMTDADWIFSIDADEEIKAPMVEEIKQAVEEPMSGYYIPRRNIIFGREIKHTRWAPDAHIWLYRKSKGKFSGDIHEEVAVKGEVGRLKNAKVHYSHKTVSEFISKINSYTTLEAAVYKREGYKATWIDFFWWPAKSFIGRYFLKFGFLDGWQGFVLSVLRAYYKNVLWVKIKLL